MVGYDPNHQFQSLFVSWINLHPLHETVAQFDLEITFLMLQSLGVLCTGNVMFAFDLSTIYAWCIDRFQRTPFLVSSLTMSKISNPEGRGLTNFSVLNQ